MNDALPCPFCGSPAKYTLSKSANTQSIAKCSVMDCPGAVYWLPLKDWNKPRKTPDTQAMYAQFEASLKAEAERKNSHLEQAILNEALALYKRRWDGQDPSDCIPDFRTFIELLQEYNNRIGKI